MLYASQRYYIPFGWWANNIPSTASTGWAVLVDSNHNPFLLTGAYSSSYATAPPAPAGSAACSAHPKCKAAALTGKCCPTQDGVNLSCC